MTKVSKPFFFIGYIGSVIIASWLLLSGLAIVAALEPEFTPLIEQDKTEELEQLLNSEEFKQKMSLVINKVLAGVFIFVVAMIILYRLVHKMWKVIPAQYARTTPGKAVGFLLIPFFNIYWNFQAYWGWAQDYKKYVEANNITAPLVSENFALAFCILPILALFINIPMLSIAINVGYFATTIIFLNQVINAVNYLIDFNQNKQNYSNDPNANVTVEM